MDTTVTLTGTGTPLPVPGRAGPGTLLRCGEWAAQVDAGRGTVLRLAELGLRCPQIGLLALTHYHSDHLVDMADLVLTRWVQGEFDPLPVLAPEGPTARFARRVLDNWEDDIAVRSHHGGRPTPPALDVRTFTPTETPTTVWRSGTVDVSAVAVRHEPVEDAVAYRFDTSDGAVVVSGDTRVCAEIEQLARGVDVLVHEACRTEVLRARGKDFIADYHADTVELGVMAERAGVATLVLTHLEPGPTTGDEANTFAEEVRRGGFSGQLVVGEDHTTVPVSSEPVSSTAAVD
ncbi:ribonuclease Z [Halopolyspora algeriensis]|uniref:Ribonuclease Z n=1 Tax=Halopolyspora algeriensis TaxID=1500506 RepID=A0A368VEK4_9ACTN|nr:MBL fold metallo-hydrolase [Halopolyspora algeriensis]RCW39629.1 ribonuclease Z [Halopolyspora algeriensis]TQM54077.1 ribonuclease Z [Halopolyspora algeriensis]